MTWSPTNYFSRGFETLLATAGKCYLKISNASHFKEDITHYFNKFNLLKI